MGSEKSLNLHDIFFNFFLIFVDASMEADVAKGRRDWAFSERDKVSFQLSANQEAIKFFVLANDKAQFFFVNIFFADSDGT